MSPAAAKELGEQRESWCAVEMKKEQSWDRKNRKHYDEILESTVFDIHKPKYEPRCSFEVNAPTHRERRHFDQQCKFKAFKVLPTLAKQNVTTVLSTSFSRSLLGALHRRRKFANFCHD